MFTLTTVTFGHTRIDVRIKALCIPCLKYNVLFQKYSRDHCLANFLFKYSMFLLVLLKAPNSLVTYLGTA